MSFSDVARDRQRSSMHLEADPPSPVGIKLVDNAIDLVDEEHSLLPDEKVLVAAYRF
jgi:hypothetical protein